MSRLLSIRPLTTAVALTAAWCGLWGSVSVANVLSGLTVSALVLASGVGTSGEGGVRIIPLLRLIWLVLIDLISSTYKVAFEVLTPTDYTRESIVAVPTAVGTQAHFLLMTVAITLTPGTAVVDADTDTGTLYVHLLHHDRRDATTKQVQRLAQLACEALPVAAKEADE